MAKEPAQHTLEDHLAALRRQRVVVVSTTVIVASVVLILSLMQTKIFESSAQVLLSRQNLGSAVTGTQDPGLSSDPERLAQTQVGIARLPRVADDALRAANLGNRSTGSLLDNSSVSVNTNSDLLTFTVNDPDPEIAAKLATAYATAYTEYSLELATQTLKRARSELQQRLTVLRDAGDTSSPLVRSLEEDAQLIRTLELLQNPGTVVKTAGGAFQVKPTPVRNALLGAMFGLLLGIGLAFIWEALDKKARSEDEIEERLGLPLLSRIPTQSRRFRKANRLVMLANPSGHEAETIRRLRVNFEFANIDHNARKIMITSAIQEEGKSTTIANLAIALARAGRDVVLVDLDLRSPSIAGYFNLRGTAGVTDVASGRVPLSDVLNPIPLSPGGLSPRANGNAPKGSLAVVPCGTLPSNPGEFVGTAALAGVLTNLEQAYDFVLVDAPPMCIVGDAMTLSAQVDAMIVVARLGLVEKPMLDELDRELRASRAPRLGVVVTNGERRDTYGYGYGGHDGPERAEAEMSDERVRQSTAASR